MVMFSFFCWTRGGAGAIRGIQMADYLGGKFNPPDGYQNDTCIFVSGIRVQNEPSKSYYDFMDCGMARITRTLKRTSGPVIAVSKTQYTDLVPRLNPSRRMYLIPQHHCNFRRERRSRNEVVRVGAIGGDSCIQWPHHRVGEMLRDIGMEWKFENHYHRRWRVIRFYKNIDIQISFRPTHPRGLMLHMNPLKLSNAGSFGIPTISFPEPAYVEEWRNECFWANSISDIVAQCKRLRDNPSLYEDMSEKALAKAENYHIDKIAQLYRELP